MGRLLQAVVALLGCLFVLIGVQWLVMPDIVAPQFGLELSVGLGLSSQVGDMAAFFLLLGFCSLWAVANKQPHWLYPASLLLVLTAVGRVVAWLIHDAAFAGDMILVELMSAAILGLAAKRLTTELAKNG